MNKQRYKKYKPVTESYDEQEKTISKVKRAIDNFAGQITVNSDLEKDVGEFLLKKGISFMKDDSNLSKGKITFKLGYKKLKESYPINAFSDAQSKTFDRLDNILSKIKSLNRKYVPRKSIDGTDKVMLSKSGKDFVNIYKDGSFEILGDNGKVTARIIDINDFSDNDIGRIFMKELSVTESLKDDDKLRKINILYRDAINHGVPSSKLDKILIKNGADPNADTFDVGLKVDSAYEELTNYLRDIYKVKGLSNTPYKSYEILGLEDYFEDDEEEEDLRESLLKIGLFS